MGFITQTVDRFKTLLRSGAGMGASPIAPQTAGLSDRRTQSGVALQYYEGLIPKQLTTNPGEPDDNIAVNYAQVIVAKGVAFLFGDEVAFDIGASELQTSITERPLGLLAGDAQETEDAGDYIDRVWPVDQRDEDLIDLATDGAISGDAWLKISIRESGDPLVSILDPDLMAVDTDPHDFRSVACYRCQYETLDANGRKIIYREETSPSDTGHEWVIREFVSYSGGQTWTRIPDETIWNYPFAPIFHARNLPRSKSFYGRADLTPSVLALIKYLSRMDSLVGKIVRAHSSPKAWARGIVKQELQMSTSGMLFLGQSPDAQIGLLEMTGDLQGALAFRRLMREALSEVSHVPEVASGKMDNVGQLSGLALRILYGPLVDQTRTKRKLYGAMLKRVIQALLTIGGYGRREVVIHWPEMIPKDPGEIT